MITQGSIHTFLSNLAARTPAPGGGASAAISGAIAAAQARMVVAFSRKKSLDESAASALDAIESRLKDAEVRMARAADEDGAAMNGIADAWKRSKDDPDRAAAIERASRAAVEPPAAVIASCRSVLEALETLVPIANKMLLSDVSVAAVLAEAGAASAACSVRINLPGFGDAAEAERVGSETENALAWCAEARGRLEGVAGG